MNRRLLFLLVMVLALACRKRESRTESFSLLRTRRRFGASSIETRD